MFKVVAKYAACVCAVMLLTTAAPALAAGIYWEKSYTEALKSSKATQKPIMVVFTADWCVFCKKLENQTFTDSRVIKMVNENFIAVKIDKDKEKKIVADFGVQGIPDIYFLTPFNTTDGVKTISRQLGYIDADSFYTGLKQINDYVTANNAAAGQ